MTYTWTQSGAALIGDIEHWQATTDAPAIWYIGQMGLAIRWQGTTLYIDPVLNDLTDEAGTTRRNYPQPYAADALAVDYVFCTHNHADHLNLATLLPIYEQNTSVRFVVPAPLTHVLTDAGIAPDAVIPARADEPLMLPAGSSGQPLSRTATSSQSAAAGQPHSLQASPQSAPADAPALQPTFTVHPVAAAHEDYQTDANGDQLCLGYILEMGGTRIYHAGDTLVTDRLVADLQAHAPYDALFLPINGRDEERHRQNIIGNMNIPEAADLAHTVGTRLVIPMHYDMVMGNGEDPEQFAAYMDAHYPAEPYRILHLGERLGLGEH